MKQTHLAIFATLMAGVASNSYALFVANVNTTGSGGAFTTIQAAVDACTASADPVCRVDIIEAATYDDPIPADTLSNVVVPGGYALTIQGTVAGVIIDQSVGGANALSASAGGSGNVDITLNNLTLRRTAATGPTLKFDARPANTVSVTINNCTVLHSLATLGGEAIKLDVGAEDGPGVTLNITSSTVTSTSTGNDKAAIRIQSNTGDFDNLTLNVTDSTLNSGDSVIRFTGASLENIDVNLLRSTLNSPADRGFEVTNPMPAAQVSVTECTFNTEDESIIIASTGRAAPGCVYTINRCTINKTAGAATLVRALDLRFDDINFTSRVHLYNSIIRTPAGTSTTARGIDVADCLADVYHNTFLATGAAGTTGSRAVASANSLALAGSTVVTLSNNAFINYGQPTPSTEDVVGGSTVNSNNLVAGPVSDANLGGSTVYTTTATGDAANLANAGLNPTTLVPQAGSVTLAAGDPSSTISTAVGAIDRISAVRPNPVGTNPDIGAFEVVGPSASSNWLMYR